MPASSSSSSSSSPSSSSWYCDLSPPTPKLLSCGSSASNKRKSPTATMKKSENDSSKKSSCNGGSSKSPVPVRYGECRKNHAARIGGYAVDGCREFMAAGPIGTADALRCAACGCHRSFHWRLHSDEPYNTTPPCDYSSDS